MSSSHPLSIALQYGTEPGDHLSTSLLGFWRAWSCAVLKQEKKSRKTMVHFRNIWLLVEKQKIQTGLKGNRIKTRRKKKATICQDQWKSVSKLSCNRKEAMISNGVLKLRIQSKLYYWADPIVMVMTCCVGSGGFLGMERERNLLWLMYHMRVKPQNHWLADCPTQCNWVAYFAKNSKFVYICVCLRDCFKGSSIFFWEGGIVVSFRVTFYVPYGGCYSKQNTSTCLTSAG